MQNLKKVDKASFMYVVARYEWGISAYKYSDTSANEDNSFRNHIR